MKLATLSVLVCRPEAMAAPFCQQLEQLGARCYPVPALQIEALQSTAERAQIEAQLATLGQCDKFIVISQNAVHHAWPYLRGGRWPQCQLLAIGSATAEAARDLGLAQCFGASASADEASAMTSEALLALPELARLDGQRVMIARGRGGRETLAQTLRQRGARVDYCELYQRSRPPQLERDLDASGFAAAPGRRLLLVHSGESLQNLDSALGGPRASWRQLPLIVPGQRVAELAASLGYSQVYPARNAGWQAVLECLYQLQQRNSDDKN